MHVPRDRGQNGKCNFWGGGIQGSIKGLDSVISGSGVGFHGEGKNV